jgi:hypothetical protein
VKVIKRGRKQKGWVAERTCTGSGNGDGGCKARLLVEEADLFRTGKHYYDGSSDYYVTFKCSACGVLTDLPEGLYPGDESALPKGIGG